MNKLVLKLTDSYLLHLTVTKHNGLKTVTIDSQWTGAKDPEGLQRRFQLTIDDNKLDEINQFLAREIS